VTGCRIVYVSLLKALAVDVERNLRSPLAGMANMARRMGVAFREPTISVRTGDTPQRERARFARHPADILITTPESLYLLLTSQASEALRTVDTVIVDEIHALVPTKRGAHLALTLERLEALTKRRLQRIGLSATQRPLEEVARFLGGVETCGGADVACATDPAVLRVEDSHPGDKDKNLDALKGHGFSRAEEMPETKTALAAEGMHPIQDTFPRTVGRDFSPGMKAAESAQALAPDVRFSGNSPISTEAAWSSDAMDAATLRYRSVTIVNASARKQPR
jgi:Lhr-like helicase